ncbi:MAG: tRNA (guanosine(37)-N1)-methyltransferase TrmD [Clostridiales bacterium]|nr:tRNA (guanosine(37)-N1)-methyltransferase TrmD [Clostridia bacterium]MDI9513430.1 tRNA (guanosine(37)-N1)-methyltransferase TrmD [Bacillota bacterium]NLH59518.1 tRNA (guanosine(37)-N1)-methyltransferase TrmD [Clostridiales bacterium]
MRIDILTLFPELFKPFISTSIMGRAIDNNLVNINTHNIRDFAKNKHRQVDDYPYGGGAGMVMAVQPLYDALDHVIGLHDLKPTIIYLSPQGRVLDQAMVADYSRHTNIILLCGHYEGIDQRVIDKYVDQEISIGDYVLTGGELAAMVFVDSVTRLIPGVLGSSDSILEESHTNHLLEYPHYTRPSNYKGDKVPEVLLSGNHKEIDRWRRTQSLKNTLIKRPDMLSKAELSDEDQMLLKELKEHK